MFAVWRKVRYEDSLIFVFLPASSNQIKPAIAASSGVRGRLLSRLAVFFVVLAGAAQLHAVTVTNFTPQFGSVGDIVTIQGSGFSPGTLVVRFNGTQDTSAAATGPGTISAKVPPGGTSGPISVQVNGGTPASTIQDFTVIGAGPYITGFSPPTGAAGDVITITGAHFSAATNAYFSGRAGTAFHVGTDNSISVTAPAGVVSGPISVRAPLGTNTATTNFFVPPVITGFSPANGRSGTNVIITGTNFLNAIDVKFGSVLATSFLVLSNGAISATVPAGALTGVVRVDAPAGSFTTTSNFVIRPVISGFSPAFGAPGTSVTISGANLAGVTSVQFNGVAASFSGASFGSVVAVVPPTATSGPISVTTPDGTATSATNFYLPAGITSFTPNNSAPGSFVRINGVNFTNATAVSFNGVAAAGFFVTNNTTIGAIVPFGVSTGPISVTTPAGTAVSTGLFYSPPGIIVFTPTHGLPGTNVTLTGTNFVGATSVLFNGLPATFFVTNNTTIGAFVPVGAQTGPITVIAPAGTNTTSVNFVLDYTSDLVVTITNSFDPVLVGTNFVYTIKVVNNGPYSAPNVQVFDTLPTNLLLRAATTTQGTLLTNLTPLQVSLGPLGIGSTATITFTVTALSAGTITNTASATSDYGDPTPANATASVVNTILPLPLLSIRKLGVDQLRISWPVLLTNYTLQYISTLSTNSFWSNVTTTPSIIGSERLVLETNNTPARFYRLKP